MDRYELITGWLEKAEEELWRLSMDLFERPEMGFEEYYASKRLTGFLEKEGFAVDRGVAGLDTAFSAAWGQGSPLAFIAEYDAVSEKLGHACGHNFIAAASCGAAAALKAAGVPAAAVGTPAEEEGGGKVIMHRAGVFGRFRGLMYLHPSNRTRVGGRTLAALRVRVGFRGHGAHATRDPGSARNALRALLLTISNFELLKDSLREGLSNNWIITEGGESTGLVPGRAGGAVHFFSEEPEDVESAVEALRRVAEAVGRITECEGEVLPAEIYLPRKTDENLARAMEAAFELCGLDYSPMPSLERGFTDVGNVSRDVPLAEGYIRVCDCQNHTVEFREAMVSGEARKKLLAAARVLAFAGLKLHEESKEGCE